MTRGMRPQRRVRRGRPRVPGRTPCPARGQDRRSRRRCPCSASTSWPARPCSTRARPTCTCGGELPATFRAGASADTSGLAARGEGELTGPLPAPRLRATTEDEALIGTSTRQVPSQRPGGWCEPGWRRRRMEPGATGPNAGRRTGRDERPGPRWTPSRLRRRAPAIQGGTDPPAAGHRTGTPGPSARVAHRRTSVAPREDQRPFVPE